MQPGGGGVGLGQPIDLAGGGKQEAFVKKGMVKAQRRKLAALVGGAGICKRKQLVAVVFKSVGVLGQFVLER